MHQKAKKQMLYITVQKVRSVKVNVDLYSALS